MICGKKTIRDIKGTLLAFVLRHIHDKICRFRKRQKEIRTARKVFKRYKKLRGLICHVMIKPQSIG